MPPWLPAAIALMVVCLSTQTGPDASPKALRRFVRNAGLPLASEDSHLADRLGTREAAVAKGGLTLVTAITAVGLLVPAFRPSSAWAIALIGAFLIGRAAGPVLSDLKRAMAPLPADSPRVARPATPTVGDHIAPAERAATAAIALLPAVLVAGAVLAAATDLIDGGALSRPALVAVPVAALLLPAGTEFLAARLVRAPRPSVTRQRLVQDDALRAQSLRTLYHSGSALGLAACFAVLVLIEPAIRGGWPEDPMRGVEVGTFIVCSVMFLSFVIIAASGMPGRRFLRRLWPQEAAEGSGAPEADTP